MNGNLNKKFEIIIPKDHTKYTQNNCANKNVLSDSKDDFSNKGNNNNELNNNKLIENGMIINKNLYEKDNKKKNLS